MQTEPYLENVFEGYIKIRVISLHTLKVHRWLYIQSHMPECTGVPSLPLPTSTYFHLWLVHLLFSFHFYTPSTFHHSFPAQCVPNPPTSPTSLAPSPSSVDFRNSTHIMKVWVIQGESRCTTPHHIHQPPSFPVLFRSCSFFTHWKRKSFFLWVCKKQSRQQKLTTCFFVQICAHKFGFDLFCF